VPFFIVIEEIHKNWDNLSQLQARGETGFSESGSFERHSMLKHRATKVLFCQWGAEIANSTHLQTITDLFWQPDRATGKWGERLIENQKVSP